MYIASLYEEIENKIHQDKLRLSLVAVFKFGSHV